MHMCPGAVSTAMMTSHPSLPWFVWIFAYVIFIFTASSPAQYADVAVREIASEEGKGMARTFWDQYGREVGLTDTSKLILIFERVSGRTYFNLEESVRGRQRNNDRQV